MTQRRLPLLVFLGVNVAVSVVTTLLVLMIWDSRREPTVFVAPTFSGVSSVSEAPPGAGPENMPSEGASGGQPTPSGGESGEGMTEGGGAGVLSATDTPAPIIHVVQPGEVMGAIAESYGVPVEDIVIANNLESPDVLDVGQELIIPVGGLSAATPTLPSVTATVELEPIATVTPLPPGTISVTIEEVLFPGDVTKEAVRIVNEGAKLDMEGWVLSDEDGNEYVFPTFTLFGSGASVMVHTGVGEDSASDLYWGLSTPVWGDLSDTAILRDPTGEVQSEFFIEQ